MVEADASDDNSRKHHTVHQQLETSRDTISPFQLPSKMPNISTLSCQQILMGGRAEEPPMGSNNTSNAWDELMLEMVISSFHPSVRHDGSAIVPNLVNAAVAYLTLNEM